jgi:EAL domain-containing protein (putative c-di-GMP-specific phosphodiesterase class I)
LYFCPPLGHTLTKLREAFRRLPVEWQEPAPQTLALDMATAGTAFLHAGLSDALTRAELQDTRCLILPCGHSPTIGDLSRVESMQSLLARVQGRWLINMIGEQRLCSYFQPIVVCDRPEEIFAHECLLRGIGNDGRLVMPNEMYALARDANLLFMLDRAARLRHIKSAIEQQLSSQIFINFNPTAIYDPTYCLRSTVRAIAGSGFARDRFVFEVVESDAITDLDRLPRILEYYRENGYKVALDDFGAGFGSVNLLTRLKPDYIKLDMHLLRDVDSDPYKAKITAKLLEMARDLGVLTIAEGIETEAEYHWALRHGADFVQGYLFGAPTPAEVTLPAAVRVSR